MKEIVRIAIGSTTLLLVSFCTGCIDVPVPNNPANHWNKPATKLRVGESDRASVLSALGKPEEIDGQPEISWDMASGRFWEYRYLHLTGYELWLIPGPCNPFWSANYIEDLLTISFDARGRVERYSLSRRH